MRLMSQVPLRCASFSSLEIHVLGRHQRQQAEEVQASRHLLADQAWSDFGLTHIMLDNG